jgi:hypothetical protein
MSAASPTLPEPPAHAHPIDPMSHALGALETDVHAIKERLDKIDVRLEQLPGKWELRILLTLVVAVLAAIRVFG